MKVLITGSAGYIGSLLVNRFLQDKRITKIIGIDLRKRPKRIPDNPKLSWLKFDLTKDGWQKIVLENGMPDVVIHCAFKIRSAFGIIKITERKNLEICRKVFQFCFENNVKKLIYLSSVAAYGAKKENIGALLKESDLLQETTSPYGNQKRLTENELNKLKREYNPESDVCILRLNSVTGPIGQSLSSKFGLVTILTKVFPFVMELSPEWARQFVHEKDVANAIEFFVFKNPEQSSFEVFNVASKTFLKTSQIANALNKKTIKLPAGLVKLGLTLFWPLSFGKLIPPSAVSGLTYPINVDISKIENAGFSFAHSAKDALLGKE
ncbi:MAG: NAD-dependent epimerase/dehydratase family protein [bacterium]|nr:NAD-dependent epimerase/dehydratase family protein [bacterium]